VREALADPPGPSPRAADPTPGEDRESA